eukprot:7702714-Ditylum_brightwellii.AAC.1
MDCPQLRSLVAALGGTVTHNKNELIDTVKGMKKIEAAFNPIVINNHSGLMLPSVSFKSNLVPRMEIETIINKAEMKLLPNKWKQDILMLALDCYKK